MYYKMDINTFIITALENNIIRELQGAKGFPIPYDLRTDEERYRQILSESAIRLIELKPEFKGMTPRNVIDFYRLGYMMKPPFDLDFLD